MTTARTAQDRFLDCLRQGDLAGAQTLLDRGTDLSAQAMSKPSDVFRQSSQFNAQVRLVTAAGQAPDARALDWLLVHQPELRPTGQQAHELLGRVLEGRTDVRHLWLADWLVANTELVPHLKAKLDQYGPAALGHLTFKALNRTFDTAGLAWLLHPPAPFPVWQDNPADPILSRAVSSGSNYKPEQRLPQLVYLLRQGVKPLITPAPTNPQGPGNSPLQVLLYDYENAVAEQERSPSKRVKEEFETLVATLWPLLVQAGDDPDRRLGNRQTAREMIMTTPLGDLALAMDRAQAVIEGPVPEQPRRRVRVRS